MLIQIGNDAFPFENLPWCCGFSADCVHRDARDDGDLRPMAFRSWRIFPAPLRFRNRNPIRAIRPFQLRPLEKRAHQKLQRCLRTARRLLEQESFLAPVAENRVANREPMAHRQAAWQPALPSSSNRNDGSVPQRWSTTWRLRRSGWRFQKRAPVRTQPSRPAFFRKV